MRPGPLLSSIVRTGPGSALGVDSLDLGCREDELPPSMDPQRPYLSSIHAAVQPRTPVSYSVPPVQFETEQEPVKRR